MEEIDQVMGIRKLKMQFKRSRSEIEEEFS
jgi:hypothetical protein